MWLDKLKEMKSRSGMTTKEIAARSGIPEPTLEKVFAGATKDPKLTTMYQIVHFLGYTLDDLDGDLNTEKLPSAGETMLGEEREDSLRSTLLCNFDQLNEEGQERLVETSDDMVRSDKYIKSDPAGLDQEQAQ